MPTKLNIIKKNTLITFFCFLFLPVCLANAANINLAKASYNKNTFLIKVTAVVKANPEKVFAILTNYDQLEKISPKIIESRILQDHNNKKIVKTFAKTCVLFLCKTIINTQEVIAVNLENKYVITSSTIASESNLKFGYMQWQIEPVSEGSKITYIGKIEPNFLVPQFIGQYFIKNILLTEAKNLLINLEKLTSSQRKLITKIDNF